jgi:hypothetical protein
MEKMPLRLCCNRDIEDFRRQILELFIGGVHDLTSTSGCLEMFRLAVVRKCRRTQSASALCCLLALLVSGKAIQSGSSGSLPGHDRAGCLCCQIAASLVVGQFARAPTGFGNAAFDREMQ